MTTCPVCTAVYVGKLADHYRDIHDIHDVLAYLTFVTDDTRVKFSRHDARINDLETTVVRLIDGATSATGTVGPMGPPGPPGGLRPEDREMLVNGLDRIKAAVTGASDEIDLIKAGQSIYEAHVENLIERMADAEEAHAALDEAATVLSDTIDARLAAVDATIEVLRDHGHTSTAVAGSIGGSHHSHGISPPIVSVGHSHGPPLSPPPGTIFASGGEAWIETIDGRRLRLVGDHDVDDSDPDPF